MASTNGMGDKSSTRVSNAPGGKSNFTLGWDGSAEPQKTGIARQYHNSSSVFGSNEPTKAPTLPRNYEENKNNIISQETQKSSVRVNSGPGGQSNFSFGQDATTDYSRKTQGQASIGGNGPAEDPKAKSSVKVAAPPGGKSSITFG